MVQTLTNSRSPLNLILMIVKSDEIFNSEFLKLLSNSDSVQFVNPFEDGKAMSNERLRWIRSIAEENGKKTLVINHKAFLRCYITFDINTKLTAYLHTDGFPC